MRVLIGRHIGFCFGVRRAVEIAERYAKEKPRVYTYGQIIHNEQVVRELEQKGVVPCESPDALQAGDTLIIRAHGAPPSVYAEAERKGVCVVDATCPFVKRIHVIVKQAAESGSTVYVVGKPNHPEVVGVCGWANGKATVLETEADALSQPRCVRATVVAQTTLPEERFLAIAQALSSRCESLDVRDTVCDTTRIRQSEAITLAKACTRVYVLGSERSANTQKLFELCQKYCEHTEKVAFIEKLLLANLHNDDIIGVVAGASTPDRMIREVLQGMSEQEKTTIETVEAEAPAEEVVVTAQEPILTEEAVAVVEEPAAEAVVEPETAEEPKVEEPAAEAVTESETAEKPKVEEPAKAEEPAQAEESSDFAEAFEKTMTRIRNGQLIEGTVLSIVDGEVYVNIGYKSDGIIPKSEFSSDPDAKPDELFKEGDTIEVEVTKVNDGEGNVLLSRKSVESKKIWDELMEREDLEDKVFEATGKEVVKGGLIADIGGIRAFVPASQVSTKYVENLGEYVGKPMKLKVLEVDKQRKRIVASQKQVMLAEAAAERRAKWEALVVGSKVPGVVRRITDFGAFVDIGGVDGLVHVTDAAWGRVKHPSDVFSIGQEIEVLILGVDVEKERVSLGYKQLQPKPWTLADTKYPVGSIVEGKVVRIVPFGAFVALESTIDGLIHISQVSVHRIAKVEDELKVGDVVRCKVLEVNPEAKRISLSRKDALLEEDPDLAAQVAAERAERDRVYAERQEQRAQQREQQTQQRVSRDSSRSERSSSASSDDRRDRGGDRRRRSSEDGEYELPPVQESTTSLASLFKGIKVDDE